jgi:hypothetical protein
MPIVRPVDIVPELFTIQNTHTVLTASVTHHQPFTVGTQANVTHPLKTTRNPNLKIVMMSKERQHR